MNVLVFIAIAAFAVILLIARGLATRSSRGAPLSTVIVVVAWLFYLATRMVMIGTFDAAWLSYAVAGTLLGAFCITPVAIRLPLIALRGWEIAYLVLLGAYLVVWSASGRLRSGVFLDPNTEGIILLLLSTPIWLRYTTIAPIYIWMTYVCLLASTLSRSSALMAFGFLLGAIFYKGLARKEIVAPTLLFVVFVISGVALFDPSQMPNADGASRFLSLNDGSFYERRALLLAAVSMMTTDVPSFLFGSSINAFVISNGNAVHNSFAELFLGCGLFGGSLFVIMYGMFVTTYLNKRNFGIFFGFTLSAGFAVLMFNSVLLLIFIFVFSLVGCAPVEESGRGMRVSWRF